MCRLLLGASEADLQAAKQRVDVLAAHLPGADIAWMVQEDPSLMFEELEPSKQAMALPSACSSGSLLLACSCAWPLAAVVHGLPICGHLSCACVQCFVHSCVQAIGACWVCVVTQQVVCCEQPPAGAQAAHKPPPLLRLSTLPCLVGVLRCCVRPPSPV